MVRIYKIILVFLSFVFISVDGLYEDQINKYDWKKGYIGKINNVVFESSLSIGKNLYVATEKNIVASLSSKNGELNWRQILDGEIVQMVQYLDGILTVTSKGIVRAWDTATGLLKWDTKLNFEAIDLDNSEFTFLDVALMELTYAESDLVAILCTNGLFTIRVQPGSKTKVKAQFVEISGLQSASSRLLVDSESKKIIVLNINEGISISVNFFDAKTLEIDSENNIQSVWLDNIKNVIVLENHRLVYASNGMNAFYVIDIQKGEELLNQPVSNFDLSSGIVTFSELDDKDVSKIGTDFFVVTETGEVAHLRLSDENKINIVSKSSGTSQNTKFCDVSVKKVGKERYYFISRVVGQNLFVQAFDAKNGKEDEALAMKYQIPSDAGQIEKVFVNMYLKRTSPVGSRVLVTTSDDTVLMVLQPTRLAWRREEALASVVTAEMLDLPLSDIEAGIEVEFEQAEKHSIFEMFVSRINAQIGQVKAFTKHFTKGIKDGTLFEKKTKDPLIQDESMTRDPFSLHKMLLLVTKPGKLFGIDSLSGEIIWRLCSPEMKGMSLRLFVQRTTAHFPNPPAALLLGISKVSNPVVLTFNPITGEKSSHTKTSEFDSVMEVMLLPFPDDSYLRPLMVIDKSAKVHFITHNSSLSDFNKNFKVIRDHIYIYHVDRDSLEISGFRFHKSIEKMEKTWSIVIPEDQKIIAIKGKDFFEKIDSMGRPLADRSVIYKYLNPNLVAVFTASKITDQNSALTMYIIDGVSGRVIHIALHKKARGPVHVVHSENWLMYSFWNVKNRRTEIASFEFYEGEELRNETHFSSFDDMPGVPVVISQSYIFAGTVNALGASRTEKGLTTREILIGLGRGGVLGLPRRIFDPRRPLYPEQSHQMEGLIPYIPEIQIHPGMLLNYNKTIQGITNIYSCPSALESTSIVLVTGLDLFFTRTQPSKMFDVLKEDFEYLLIGAVVSAMFVAAIVTRKMAQNKKLKKAWK